MVYLFHEAHLYVPEEGSASWEMRLESEFRAIKSDELSPPEPLPAFPSPSAVSAPGVASSPCRRDRDALSSSSRADPPPSAAAQSNDGY